MENEFIIIKMVKMENELIDLKSEIDNHIDKENEHLSHIRESNHKINQSLQRLQNPIITVKNGTKKNILQSEAIAELWESTQTLRTLNQLIAYFSTHKIVKTLIYLIVIFAVMGIMSTPINLAAQIIIKILRK